MSYCRIGRDSDVYCYLSVSDFEFKIIVHNAQKDIEDVSLKTHAETIEHLTSLKEQGYKVPPRTFKRLKTELRELLR